MKTFVVNSSRWNWVGAAANTSTKEIAVTDAGKSHKLFSGITIGEDATISLVDDSYTGNAVVTFDAWNTNLTSSSEQSPITLATPAGGTLGSYAEIKVGSQLGATAADVTTHPVLLLGLSESSWNNLTTDAKTIVSNAFRYAVNDTFSVGIVDKATDNDNKVVAYKEYYDIMGKKLSAQPVNTIAIEKVVYEDGSVKYTKVRYAK